MARRRVSGWILMALGGILVIWAAVGLASLFGVGGRGDDPVFAPFMIFFGALSLAVGIDQYRRGRKLTTAPTADKGRS